MARDYIDLVVVKMNNGKKYLFRAPSWSRLDSGDEVFVDTVNGPELGKVVVVTTEPNEVGTEVRWTLSQERLAAVNSRRNATRKSMPSTKSPTSSKNPAPISSRPPTKTSRVSAPSASS